MEKNVEGNGSLRSLQRNNGAYRLWTRVWWGSGVSIILGLWRLQLSTLHIDGSHTVLGLGLRVQGSLEAQLP